MVALRAREYAGLRRLLYQEGFCNHSRSRIRQMSEDELEEVFKSPEVRMTAAQEFARIDLYSEQIHAMERRIMECAGNKEGYRRLHEIPGLGDALAAVVFYESGGMQRFPGPRNYSSYSRVVPGAADSAGKTSRGRGSKQGNPHLKSAFSQAAVHAVLDGVAVGSEITGIQDGANAVRRLLDGAAQGLSNNHLYYDSA